jgi:phosphatidylserine/phosphatidylglycerophosphate/cardiolipin synthase-like enzyme
MALDCKPTRLAGLKGFAFQRSQNGGQSKWLRSLKVFKSLVPNPKALVGGHPQRFSTLDHPVQSFLWSDYTAEPGTAYTFTIRPMYGTPGHLTTDPDDQISVTLMTEPEIQAGGHSIWFNRGAIASQAYAREFGNVKPTPQQLDNLNDRVTRWLSRGLAEACRDFIDQTPSGAQLRACLYEFTYAPILQAFKDALARGVDVGIAYHKTAVNDQAIEDNDLPEKKGSKRVLFPRTVPKIPHNKFIVRVVGGMPTAVWTGSTNITPSGFLGQSNVGHLIEHSETASVYLEYWRKFSRDPDRETARASSTRLSPHPKELPAASSLSLVFSPRYSARMLNWYANRITDATGSVMFTAAFGVNKKLLAPLAKDREFLRFILMEKRPNKELKSALKADRDLVVSYGAVLGETTVFKDGKLVKKKIENYSLEEWFREEELYRKEGNIFFIHTKFLLVDPLSNDPLVCSGSANFSDGSLLNNDENMLLVRGNTRVADIYMTEFDRLFRHFYFRDVANEIEQKGDDAKGAFLDESDGGPDHWTVSYFGPGRFKSRRREMFFATGTQIWTDNAAKRPADESAAGADQPAKKKATRTRAKGKARRKAPR